MSICAAMLGGASTQAYDKSVVRIWQNGPRLLVQRAGSHVTLRAPGAYNSYPDYRILSPSGRILAFPFHAQNGWELDYVDLATQKVSTLEKGKEVYWARVSASDRYLSALVNGAYTVFNLKTGGQRVLDSGITDVIWSREGNSLFFRRANGAIAAFDARTSKFFEPSPSLVDRGVGKAYRMYIPKSKTMPPADVSPSGEFAYMGVVKGGFVATPINGRYHPDFGTTDPYLYGVTDSHGKIHIFAAPAAYRRQPLYPFAWTRSNTLILAIENCPGTVLEYNPKSARIVVRKLKPPTKGASLVAVGD